MKVKIIEDRLGNVIVSPVNACIARRMEKDAKNNGAPDDFIAEIFMQQPSIDEVAELLGKKALFRSQVMGTWEVNDGAMILMDEWTFRHCIGYAAN